MGTITPFRSARIVSARRYSGLILRCVGNIWRCGISWPYTSKPSIARNFAPPSPQEPMGASLRGTADGQHPSRVRGPTERTK